MSNPMAPESTSYQESTENQKHVRFCMEAEASLAVGNAEAALNSYLKVHNADPRNTAVTVLIAVLYSELEQQDKASAFYRKAASNHVARNDFAKALQLLQQAASIAPKDTQVLETMIRAHLKLRSQARKLETIAKHENELITLLKKQAALYLEQHQNSEVIQSLHEVLKLHPHDLGACQILAHQFTGKAADLALNVLLETASRLLDKGEHDCCNSCLDEAEHIDPQNPCLRVLRLRGLLVKGQFKDAITGLLKLHQEHPENLDAIETLSKAYTSFNQLHLARRWFLKAFAINRQGAPLQFIATRYLAANKPAEAFYTLMPAATILTQEGSVGSAIELLLTITKKKDYGPAHRVLYCLYRMQGKEQAAWDCSDAFLSCEEEQTLSFYKAFEREAKGAIWGNYLQELPIQKRACRTRSRRLPVFKLNATMKHQSIPQHSGSQNKALCWA